MNINSLSFGYSDSDQMIINNFGLNLNKAQKLVLLGTNGVGKSSILNAIWLASFGEVLTQNQTGNVKISNKKAYFRQDIPQNLNINPQKISESYYDILYQIESNPNISESVYSKGIKDNWKANQGVENSNLGMENNQNYSKAYDETGLNTYSSSKTSNTLITKFVSQNTAQKTNINEDTLLDWYTTVASELPIDFDNRLQSNLFEMRLSPNSLANNWTELSPGTQKKILLAILFATSPEIILADELTNHLDSTAIKILIEWIKKTTSTMLIIDHNSEFLSLFRDFLFLPNNKTRKTIYYPNMTIDEAIGELDKLEQNQVLAKEHIMKRKKALDTQLKHLQFKAEVFNADIGSAAKSVRKKLKWEVEENPVIEEMDINKKVDFGKVKAQKVKKNILLEVKELSYKIGQVSIQYIAEFRLYEGEKIRLVGPNGRGKTTFIKMLRYAIENQKQIEDLKGKTLEQIRTELNNDYDNQDMIKNYSLDQYLSGTISSYNTHYKDFFVLEQVSNYPKGYNLEAYLNYKTEMMDYNIPNFLKKLHLSKFDKNTHLSSFSLGEYIRLQFGIFGLISSNIKLLILDEPGNFLDIFTQKALIEILSGYNGALVLISHDQKLVNKLEIDSEFGIE